MHCLLRRRRKTILSFYKNLIKTEEGIEGSVSTVNSYVVLNESAEGYDDTNSRLNEKIKQLSSVFCG
jgi:hypothetical protein